jgi:thiamine biosynthesis lipoprotein
MQKIEFRAMGCQMSAFVDHEGHDAAQALAKVPGWFETWEQSLSRFRPTSELNQINARSGQTVTVSPILFQAVSAALEAARWSGGLVSPTLLQPILDAGYDRSFEQLQTPPARAKDDLSTLALKTSTLAMDVPPLTAGGWQEIRLDQTHQTVTLPPGVKLDLGGTAKGWAAQQAVERLKAYGPVLVDAGGDIAVSGPRMDGSLWPVEIADPLGIQESLGILNLGTCGVATSGVDFHRWFQNGVWKHHIIDPRTGEPADTDLMSVTVVASNVLHAETAAKQVLILGSQAGLDWLTDSLDLTAVLALQDGRVLFTPTDQEDGWV